MTMMSRQELMNWRDRDVVGPDGDKIGTAQDIYIDDETGEPEWLAVTTGLLRSRVNFVPLRGAYLRDDVIVSPYDKATIKDAPDAEPDGHLSHDEEARLYRHYGVEYPEGGLPEGRRAEGAEQGITRSEEEVRVGKTSHETGRVRLRRWVETEPVRQKVPVAHEEVRIEREPVSNGEASPEMSDAEQEVVLHEEEPLVEKRAVPKEQLRLKKEVVTEEEEVGADLRKERVAVEGEGTHGSDGRR